MEVLCQLSGLKVLDLNGIYFCDTSNFRLGRNLEEIRFRRDVDVLDSDDDDDDEDVKDVVFEGFKDFSLISECVNLKKLTISDHAHLDINGISIRVMNNLEHLTLRRCGVRQIGVMMNLCHIELTNCDNLVEVDALGMSANLRCAIFIRNSRIRSIRILERCRKLRKLVCDGNVSLVEMGIFRRVRGLKLGLEFGGVNLGELGKYEYKFDRVRRIKVTNCCDVKNVVVSSGIKSVKLFGKLWEGFGVECVNMELEGVIDLEVTQWNVLVNCVNLRSLKLTCCNAMWVPKCVNLENVEVSSCNNLVGLNEVRRLKFCCVEWCDEFRGDGLSECEDLRILYVNRCKEFSDVGMLSGCRNLRSVEIISCGILDVSALGGCERLETLGLANNIGLRKMDGGFGRVRRVDVSGCLNLVDINLLGECKNLEICDVSGCMGLSDTSVDVLAKCENLHTVISNGKFGIRDWSKIGCEVLRYSEN